MKRAIFGAALLLTLPLLAACPQEGGGSTPSRAPKPPPAVAGAQPPAKFPEAERPGPEADPNACHAGTRDIELQAYWFSTSDTPPKISWSKNGAVTFATNLRAVRAQGGHPVLFKGEWGTLVQAKCHDVLVLTLEQLPQGYSTGCMIVDLGDGPYKTGERGCRATYTVV